MAGAVVVASLRPAQYNQPCMISERLARLEDTLRNDGTIPESARRDLLELLAGLKSEVAPLVESHGDTAQAIAGSAEAAVAASIQKKDDPAKAAGAVAGLAASVRTFEASHPRLVEIVDQLALTLTNLGL
jgi:hypothetical protein